MKRALFLVTVFSLMFIFSGSSAGGILVASAKKVKAPTQKVLKYYGKLPLAFEANQGQTDSQVKFLSRGKGYTLFLTPTEVVLSLNKIKSKTKSGETELAPGVKENKNTCSSSPTASILLT